MLTLGSTVVVALCRVVLVVKLNVRSERGYLLEVTSAAYLALEHKIVSILYNIDYLVKTVF